MIAISPKAVKLEVARELYEVLKNNPDLPERDKERILRMAENGTFRETKRKGQKRETTVS